MFNESTPNSTIAPREHIQGQQDCFYVDYDRDAVDAFYATYIFSIVLNSVSAMPAIFLNALVIVAICRRSSLQTPSNVLLCSLALTDFLVGLIVQPVFIAHKVSALKAERRLHCIASVVSKTLALLLGTVSLTTLTAISIDRVLAISLPSRYRTVVTKGGAVKTAIVHERHFVIASDHFSLLHHRCCPHLPVGYHNGVFSGLSASSSAPGADWIDSWNVNKF